MQDGILKYALDPAWIAQCEPGEIEAIERLQKSLTNEHLMRGIEFIARSVNNGQIDVAMVILKRELAQAATVAWPGE
jgi:hypothetical protein